MTVYSFSIPSFGEFKPFQDLAGRANSTGKLKICLSQWNKTPVYSCIGHKMGGFKLVTFPCLEKLSHAQHRILPRAVSPGALVALAQV